MSQTTNRKPIAIACQGGGSQCAFVAGALKALLANGIQHRYRVVGLSGTSGGAFTAALAWIGLLKQAHGDRAPIGDAIINCWKDLAAQTPQEILFDSFCTQALRLVERGFMPSVASSPSTARFQLGARMSSLLLGRPEFTDLGALLRKHLDFEDLPRLLEADSPVMLVGACDVVEGKAKIFSSAHGEVSIEALLASAAIPNLFPAAKVEGHAYWDGIFASNPPVSAFLRQPFMGKEKMPEEIWIIQVNRAQHDSVPERPSDVFDRRNHLAGNLSLQHELEFVAMVNMLLAEGALSDPIRARFGLGLSEGIAVRFIRMSKKIEASLDYPSKLSRQPTHIARLLAEGEAQANAFLASLGDEAQKVDLSEAGVPAQIH